MSAVTDQTPVATGVWKIAPDYSNASFTVRHHGAATFRGGFSNVKGSFDPDAGVLIGRVAVSDLLTGLDRLRKQIMTPEWFDPEQFATISFASTAITTSGTNVTVHGDLTMHGATNPIIAQGVLHGPQTVRHHDGHTTERLGLDLTTTIDRRDYGLTFNAEIAEGILNLGWDVKIEANLQLVR